MLFRGGVTCLKPVISLSWDICYEVSKDGKTLTITGDEQMIILDRT
jgi:hypothetical protein